MGLEKRNKTVNILYGCHITERYSDCWEGDEKKRRDRKEEGNKIGRNKNLY